MTTGNLPIELVEKIRTLETPVATKMLEILEREQKHRHVVEVNVRAAELRDMRRGQLFAFIIVMFFGIVGAILIHEGHDLAGGLFGGSAILGIVTTFIAGRKSANAEHVISEPTT